MRSEWLCRQNYIVIDLYYALGKTLWVKIFKKSRQPEM